MSIRRDHRTPPSVMGRYRIIEQVASGGQGTVYRADDPRGGQIALKVLHPHLSTDRDVLRRFQREARMAASLVHPNITRILEVGQDGPYHFISMEYLPLSVHELIESRGRLSVERSVAICRQAAEALQAASDKGIIHRDIKPQNLLLSSDGTVKVTDFGIARSSSLTAMTRAGALMGTPHYMSPEQAEGRRVDTRSDIYSLGVVLYQMLTGRLPFVADTPLEVMQHHIETPAPSVRRVRPDVPADLERVVARCLEKRPSQRYRFPGELARALRAEVRRPERSTPPVRRRSSSPQRRARPARNTPARPRRHQRSGPQTPGSPRSERRASSSPRPVRRRSDRGSAQQNSLLFKATAAVILFVLAYAVVSAVLAAMGVVGG